MSWIAANIDWILIVAGAGTCSMLSMAVAPRAVTHMLFGEALPGGAAVLIARSWGTMIFLSGVMLIYAAWHPEVRLPAMAYSALGKMSFVVPVFASVRRPLALAAAVGDLAIVLLFAWYLLA